MAKHDSTTARVLLQRTIRIKGVWRDRIADHWYEYPRKSREPATQTPSLCLRGRWVAAAGFVVGEKIDVQIADGLIVFTHRRKKSA